MRDEGLDGKFPSCLRRGVTLVTGWWESNHGVVGVESRLTIHESRYREVSRNEAAVI
jgi:hypothetical protein